MVRHGSPSRRRRIVAQALLGAVCAAPLGAIAQPVGDQPGAPRAELEALFARFAALGERRARFVERRHSVLFRNPPEARGTLYYKPPSLLERETTAPRRERVRIEGVQVTMWLTGGDGRVTERRVRLDVVPQLAALADTLRAMLGGDLRALERLFRVSMSRRAPDRWTLDLAPIDESIASVVRSVRVDGHAEHIDRVEFVETSGDRSEMTIEPLAAGAR